MTAELEQLLQATSRSFYKTLRVLPPAVRPQISLAYLLARTSDTIADTDLVPVPDRLNALAALGQRIVDGEGSPLEFGALRDGCSLPAEKLLLERIEDALRELFRLEKNDRDLVKEVLRVIIGGQELDLTRFAGPKDQIVALETEAELDDYTYRVAGCVGEFWTRICRAHLFPKARIDDAALLRDGVRFGKGLQLVNILRDIPKDLRNGRCYLPRQFLAVADLKPEDLLDATNMARFQPLYTRWLNLAESHLAAGWDYTNLLPWGQVRVRLACAWPILIGIATVRRLREGNVLDETQRIKVSRPELRGLVLQSVAYYPVPALWRGQFTREKSRLVKLK